MSQPETEDGSVDLLCFFKALADETRLKMAALLSRESRSSEELANLLGIKPATVSRHLSKLADSGLVTSTSKGHRPVYSLQFGGVRATAGRLLAKDRGIQVPDTDDTSDYDRKVLKDFFRSDGSLQQIPMQRKKFLVVLKQLLKGIEPAREYPEKELNAILAQHHADTATLRRGLIDYGLMNRRSGVYWRV